MVQGFESQLESSVSGSRAWGGALFFPCCLGFAPMAQALLEDQGSWFVL